MDNREKIDFRLKALEGRTFIIGREGHVYVDSKMVSRHHAEIKILNGRIHLRDLNSTNGTYLVKNRTLVYFEQGFVDVHQRVAIGDQILSILELLTTASNFCHVDDGVTLVRSIKKAV